MLWCIISIIAVVIFIIYMVVDGYYDIGEIIGLGFMSLLAAIMFTVSLTAVSSAIADGCADKTYSVKEDTEIYALQDNITTEGSFFLGSGRIDDELKYFYVEKTDLGYQVKSVDADNCYIQYTSDRCHLERQTYTFDDWGVYAFAIPIGERYIFYIPEGSIINNYSIDLG